MEKKTTTTKEEMRNCLENIKDPGLKKALSNVLSNLQDTDQNGEVAKFREEISKAPMKETQKILAFLPHQMAKTSIFFPMSDRELKSENRRITRIEHKTGWGQIVIEGIKLAIFEEDIFLALIKIAKDKIKTPGNEYILEINMKEIVKMLYGSSGYTKQSFVRIETTLQHFQLVRFELTTYTWKKKGKERLKTSTVRSLGNIVSSYKYDEKTKDLTIKFNPEFFAYFLESMLTNINFTLRRKLKKDGSKALLRFLSTHNKPDKMHMLTVLNAINFNINQPMFKLRQLFKTYLAELKKHGVLGKKTKLYKDDVVFFDILPHTKHISD